MKKRKKMNALKPHRGALQLLYPMYDYDQHMGNISMLILKDSDPIHLARPSHLVLRDYLALFALDYTALINLYAPEGKNQRIAPLPIAAGHTLIPLRARSCIGKHDGAYAFVEYESIDRNSLRKEDQGYSMVCGGQRQNFLVSHRHLSYMIGYAHMLSVQRCEGMLHELVKAGAPLDEVQRLRPFLAS